MLKQIGQYISYFMGILGFAGVIWTYATKNAENDYDVKDIRKDLSALTEIVATKQDITNLRDTINQFIYRSEKTDKTIIDRYNYLRNSWSGWLKDNVKKFDDWIKYMEGIEFELKSPESIKSVFPDTKIKIVRKDSINK